MDFIDLKENAFTVTKTPLPGYNLKNLVRLLIQNRFSVDIRYLPRLLYSLTLSGIMVPFRIKESKIFDKQIKDTEIKHHPLFIIGHWRSGTTYLHNVLSQDKNLGYFSTFQAYLPSVFLGSAKLFKPLVISSVPEKRPMDDVVMDADLPQEDQYAMGAFSPYSYYHGWCFPKNMAFYNNLVCMEDVSRETIEDWKEIYLYLLKKVTFDLKGKRLVLKNQDNTAKIKLLLEMFPNAKFILIQRNPFHLYLSMMRFMTIVIPLYCIQTPPGIEDVERMMMELYVRMFKKYLDERSHIPKGNLVEIKYETFLQQPLEELRRTYSELELDGFTESEQAFREYVQSQKSVKTHQYNIDDALRKKIIEKWDFIFEAFGYDQ